MNIKIKPILKWVGGKTQIINKIIEKMPIEFNNYREIFLGGGSVLISILYLIRENKIKIHGEIYAYDLNEHLIHVYINIQNNHDALYVVLKNIIDEYNECQVMNIMNVQKLK